MTSQSTCFDKQFLKVFQAEKNATLQLIRKGTFLLHRAGQVLHQGESLETVNEFFRLYGDREAASADANQQADVDSILEQTQALLAQGKSTKEIARLIKLDRARENQRLGRAAAQKKLEGLINRNKELAQSVLPLIDSMKHAAAIEGRLTLAAFGIMMLINSLGERFTQVTPQIIAQLSVKILDDADLIEQFHGIKQDKLLPELTRFFVQDFRGSAARTRQESKTLATLLTRVGMDMQRRQTRVAQAVTLDQGLSEAVLILDQVCANLERIALDLELWLGKRGLGTTLIYCSEGEWQTFLASLRPPLPTSA